MKFIKTRSGITQKDLLIQFPWELFTYLKSLNKKNERTEKLYFEKTIICLSPHTLILFKTNNLISEVL